MQTQIDDGVNKVLSYLLCSNHLCAVTREFWIEIKRRFPLHVNKSRLFWGLLLIIDGALALAQQFGYLPFTTMRPKPVH
jgi:hypothetical protein